MAFTAANVNPYHLCMWTLLLFGILFLSTGFALLVFGKKVPSSARIEISIAGQSINFPYSSAVFACIVGIFLLFLVLNLKGGGKPGAAYFQIFATAYAQPSPSFSAGWVYFGDEGDPQHWNFQIIGGSYSDLRDGRAGLLLKSLRDVTVRENHYGNFTGTVLQFLNPKPKAIGTLSRGTCGAPQATVSVGQNQIWIHLAPAPCTS